MTNFPKFQAKNLQNFLNFTQISRLKAQISPIKATQIHHLKGEVPFLPPLPSSAKGSISKSGTSGVEGILPLLDSPLAADNPLCLRLQSWSMYEPEFPQGFCSAAWATKSPKSTATPILPTLIAPPFRAAMIAQKI